MEGADNYQTVNRRRHRRRTTLHSAALSIASVSSPNVLFWVSAAETDDGERRERESEMRFVVILFRRGTHSKCVPTLREKGGLNLSFLF